MESDGESVDGSGSEADSEESTRLASEDELPQENSDDQTFLDLDTLTGPPFLDNYWAYVVDRAFTGGTVDLLVSFGSEHPVLVDGGALCRKVGWNDAVDWSHGGQWLQCIYIAERILAGLVAKGLELHVFFFSEAAPALAAPFRAPPASEGAQGSVSEGRFVDLVRATDPSFILTDFNCPFPDLGAQNALLQHRSQIRSCFFVHWLSQIDLPVVDMEALSTTGPRLRGKYFELERLRCSTTPFAFFKQRLRCLFRSTTELPDPKPLLEGSLRRSLSLLALREILPTSKERGLCAVFCTCLALAETLPLEERCIPSESLASLPSELQLPLFLHRLHLGMIRALYATRGGAEFDGTLGDIFDGRLFHHVTACCLQGDLGSFPGAMESAKVLWQELGATDFHASLEALRRDVPWKGQETDPKPSRQSNPLSMATESLERELPWLPGALGDMFDRPRQTAWSAESSLRDYSPHHFHSCTPLDDSEPDAFLIKRGDNMRKLLVENEMRLQALLKLLKQDGTVQIPRGQKRERWMFQISARGVSFTLARLTDPNHADAQIKSLAHLKELLGTVKAFPILLSFRMTVSAFNSQRRAQQCAGRNQKFLESLLEGSPAPRQTISEKWEKSKVQELQEAASARLAGSAVKEARKKGSPSRTDKAKQQAEASRQQKQLKQSLEKINTLKEQFKRADEASKSRRVAELLKQLQGWWADGQQEAFSEAGKLGLKTCQDLDETCPLDRSQKKRSFQVLQQILRTCGGPQAIQDGELLPKLQKLASKHLKMPVLASALGPGKEPKDSKSKKERREKGGEVGASCPKPDGWQSILLDVADAGQSALVQAPTGSGKTFIAFYVIEKALRTSDEGIVVYVCPTKALANQVHAEIEARFEKSYRDGRPFCGIFTRDRRSERLAECQILVTVPQCLIIYMLSPTAGMHAWVQRLEYAILDEVHCLGGENLACTVDNSSFMALSFACLLQRVGKELRGWWGTGEVWEQILSLLPCPILALSATLGQSEDFTSWMRKLQAQQQRELHVLQQLGRFNDLQPWVFDGEHLHRLHPFFALRPAVHASAREKIRPENLHLIPEDALQLYDVLSSKAKADLQTLAPETYFASLPQGSWNLSMQEVQQWSKSLGEAFDRAARDVQVEVVHELTMEAGAAFGCIEEDLRRKGSQEYLEARFGSLAEELQSADMLPAIVFHDSRVGCERLALALGNHLRAKVGKYRRDEKIQSKIDALVRLLNQIPVPEGRVGKDGVLILTPEEFDDVQQRKSLATAISLLEAIPQECTVTPPGRTQLTNSELEEEFDEKRDPFNPSRPLHSLLLYGVGVHHAGLPAVYRQAVERLFRMQRLGVVVSTSTLALGINMPSKTSVFAGDSIFLSPMQFQQEAGRAGRRGFDLRGHIVFFGLPGKKVQRLLVGELPRIEGSIPMTASLTLRLLMKAQVLPQAEDSVARAVGRLATCPLFCPSPSIPFQQAHLFQFFAQHVFAEGFLGPARQVTDYAGFVAHIWWEEPGNFALVSLLQERGVLTELCQGPRKNLVAVLCNFFHRRPLERWHSRTRLKKRLKSSVVELPALPEKITSILRRQRARRMLQALIWQLQRLVSSLENPNCALPLSKVQPCTSTPSKALRSPFMALSGRKDDFVSLQELCSELRDDLHLDPEMFPVLEVAPDVPAVRLNAYLLDFYQHGQVDALELDNRIPHTEYWKLLEDFMFFLRALSSVAKHRQQRAQQRGEAMELGEEVIVGAFEAISTQFEAVVGVNCSFLCADWYRRQLREKQRLIRTFDVGGTGVKTGLFTATALQAFFESSAAGPHTDGPHEAAEQGPVQYAELEWVERPTQLGQAPGEDGFDAWLEEALPRLRQEKANANVVFGVSTAGDVEHRTGILHDWWSAGGHPRQWDDSRPDPHVADLMGLPRDRTFILHDGAAHLLGCSRQIVPIPRLACLSVGTGVGFGISDEDGAILDPFSPAGSRSHLLNGVPLSGAPYRGIWRSWVEQTDHVDDVEKVMVREFAGMGRPWNMPWVSLVLGRRGMELAEAAFGCQPPKPLEEEADEGRQVAPANDAERKPASTAYANQWLHFLNTQFLPQCCTGSRRHRADHICFGGLVAETNWASLQEVIVGPDSC
ncbi:unnamed protein product, partial [Symbiodinium sp. KB8]